MRGRGDPSGQDERSGGETVHARGDDGWRWVGHPYGWQWNVNERTQGWMSQCFDLRWNVRVAGWVGAIAYPLGTRQGKMGELTGKPSMQEG